MGGAANGRAGPSRTALVLSRLRAGGRAGLARHHVPQSPRRLALFGLPPVLAEPVMMLAEILGWQVESFLSGQAVCPPARLCLALLPAGAGERGPVAAWSPELNLNELISQAGLSIMDQPLCITRVEQLLDPGLRTIVCSQAMGA